MSIVKCAKGPTPAPTSYPSGPSFDDVTDTSIHMFLEAPQDHQSAKKLVSLWFSNALKHNSLLVLGFHP
jgi:hypothetical protein